MEPARSTDDFTRRITVADSNNIVTVLDMNAINSEYQIFESDYVVKFQVVLEDLKVTVGLFSLAEAPWPDTNALMSESATMAEIAKIRTQGQKISLQLYTAKGNGPWVYQSKVVLQNQGGEETHVPILVPFLSTNETLLVGGDFKLGVRIEPIWNQPLKVNDYLVVKGTWRQIVSFSKKKDDDVEALAARIAALELALEGRLINLPPNSLLGKGSTVGTVEVIPQANFKAADANLIDGIDSTRIVFGDDWSKTIGAFLTPNAAFTTSGFLDVYGTYEGAVFPAGTGHINGFQTRHRNNTGLWGMQAGCQHNILNEFYFRTISQGTFNPWRRIWNDGNFAPTRHAQNFDPSTKCLVLSHPSTTMAATPSPQAGLEVQGANNGAAAIMFHRPSSFATFFGFDTDNDLCIGGHSISRQRIWREGQGIPVWQSPSDIRLKKNVSSIDFALDLILECKPIRFRFNSEVKQTELYGSKKEREKYHYGFIAQEFSIGDLVYEKENGFLGIDYIEIIPFLVRAIQELSEQIA